MNSGQNYKVGDKLLCRKTRFDYHGKIIWKFGKRYEILKIIGSKLFPNDSWRLFQMQEETETTGDSWRLFQMQEETETTGEKLQENHLKDYFVVGQKARKLKLMKLKRADNQQHK